MIAKVVRSINIFGAMAILMLSFQNCSGYKALSAADMQQFNGGLSHQMVNVFMASGHVGRTVMSCDDGKTWIHDRSDNDATRCWVTGDPNYLECDHTAMSGHGIDAGDGMFFTNYGWGYNGSLRKSFDGVNWEVIRSDGWGGGLAYANQALFLMWGSWSTSDDLGEHWKPVSNSPGATLDHPTLKHINDTLYAMGRTTPALAISHDLGKTWTTPAGFKAEWTGHIAEGNGVIVSMGSLVSSGNPTIFYEAYSNDGGVTWQSQQMYSGNGNWAGPIFNGTEFVAWLNGKVWRSTDGVTWSQTAIVVHGTGAVNPLNLSEPVAYNPDTGTYAMTPNNWGHYYDGQQMYRSADGITWELLDAAHFKGGHPLLNMVVGQMDSSFCR